MAIHPGWIRIGEAVRVYGLTYQSLWELVQRDVLTRGRFSAAEKRPPIYLKVEELEAFKRGGVDAVLALKDAVPTHDLGGEG